MTMNALVLAAGLGTRLKPLTDTMPKAMVCVNGKPLIWHLLTRLKTSGFTNVVVNVHHFANQIVEYIEHNEWGMNIAISDETDMLLDTGGAIKKAANLFPDDSPFLVHNVDIFHNINLKEFFNEYAYSSDATLIVSKRDTSRYLLFEPDTILLKGWINIKTDELKTPFVNVRENLSEYNKLAFSGVHIFSQSLINSMEEWGDKFSIIDFYLKSCEKFKIIGVELPQLKLLDVGKLDSLIEAEKFLDY